jgi:CyaY protein
MTESDYQQLIDNTLIAIEDALEQQEIDIDYETVSGILTLQFSDNSKIVINRQPAVEQLWIAAKSGGFHLNYDSSQMTWISDADSSLNLSRLLSRLCSEQAGEKVQLLLEQLS